MEEIETFEEWFAEVDRIITNEFFVGADDLPDQTWRDWFESEWTPRQAAEEALANSGY